MGLDLGDSPLFQLSPIHTYYRCFIPNLTKVAGLLHALIRKDTHFVWTPQCQVHIHACQQSQLAYQQLCQHLWLGPLGLQGLWLDTLIDRYCKAARRVRDEEKVVTPGSYNHISCFMRSMEEHT